MKQSANSPMRQPRLEVLGEYSLAAHFYATARELERTGTIPNMKHLRYTTRRLTP